MGWWGTFEPQEYFFRYQIHCVNFFRVNWRALIFSFNFPVREYLFCTSPPTPPPHSLPFPLIPFLMVLYTDQVQCMSHNSDLTFVTSVVQSAISCLFNTFLISLWIINHKGYIWPLAASHSRGTKRACRRAKVELGQEKQKTS